MRVPILILTMACLVGCGTARLDLSGDRSQQVIDDWRLEQAAFEHRGRTITITRLHQIDGEELYAFTDGDMAIAYLRIDADGFEHYPAIGAPTGHWTSLEKTPGGSLLKIRFAEQPDGAVWMDSWIGFRFEPGR